jgi:hypothetical protein
MPPKKTNESEKLHYETQKDNGDESQGDRERTATKTGESPRREKEKQEHLGTKRNDEQKPNAAFTKEEEMEIHQQREQIYKLKEKTERTYYRVTQIAIDKRPRLQKLQNMFKIKVTANMANKAMEEILDKKDLNITEQNHLIYVAETIIIEELNGTAENKIETQIRTTPVGYTCTEEHKWHYKGTTSVGENKKR